MYERLLQYLVCPSCAASLQLEASDEDSAGGEVVEGLLRCDGGGHTYPIVRGIPRLLPDSDGGDAQSYDRRTGDSFSNEWEHHEVGDRTWGIDLDVRVDTFFVQSIGIPKEELAGKVMVDAGCGNGSQSVAYTAFGIEVIAIDLSSGLEHGYAFRHRYPGARPELVHFVQADLQHPPVRPGSVDLVHSAGVLHHTPDTERTFRRLTPLVRDEGTFYIWVYKHERFVTPLVNAIRALTTRLSPRRFARLAKVAAEPFRLFCILVDRLGVRSYPRLSRREAALAVTDIFGAPYAHYHSFEEVDGWLKSEGFDETWPVNESRRGFGVCGRRSAKR